MTRPVIGLCASVEDVSYRVWNEAAVMLPRAYVDRLSRAGGLSILLPPDDEAAEQPDDLLDRVDALLLAGGSDIDPLSYGATPHQTVTETDPKRDRFEIALVHRALERDLPVLGVCRGMQLLNVATGGTLVQHLPEVDRSERHLREPGVFSEHEVRLEPGSQAAEAVGSEHVRVSSHHHQGVDELGEDLVASGWAVDDGIVEAIEVPGRRFASGVLWHPEVDERSRLLEALVSIAAGGASGRAEARATAGHAVGGASPASS